MRGQNNLVEVFLAQEANKELSRVRVATELCGVGAEAITIVGVSWRRILTCTCTLLEGDMVDLFCRSV